MFPLNLSSAIALLDVQVETHKPERDCNRFRVLAGMLHGEGIDDVLMDEFFIAQR